MKMELKRAAWMGLRLAVILLTAAAAVGIGLLAWETWQTRAGAPGGEALILPLMGLLLYCGWAARKALVHPHAHKKRKIREKSVAELQNVTVLIGRF